LPDVLFLIGGARHRSDLMTPHGRVDRAARRPVLRADNATFLEIRRGHPAPAVSSPRVPQRPAEVLPPVGVDGPLQKGHGW
jgi:hypothetical protein